MTAQAIAQWMAAQLEGRLWLRQNLVARHVRTAWGEDFVYKNKNRNWALAPSVLDEFRDITGESVVWSRGKQSWRARKPDDGPGRMIK